ncbi:MAG: hypothetical protein L6Q60_07300 [Rhodocyclaceae bacterium]|nr:hypothetical protein [Rhodocyclaceae bacterium]
MSEIHAKTPQGVEEVEKRAAGLTPRQRRVLIMIDGKRSVDELAAMALVEDLPGTLALLAEGGLIERVATVAAVAAPAAAADPLTEPPAFREVPATPSARDLDMARNFITNTLRTFCGAATHLSIVEAVHAAKTHEEMRAQFMPWLAAILETRSGRGRAAELRAELLKVI